MQEIWAFLNKGYIDARTCNPHLYCRGGYCMNDKLKEDTSPIIDQTQLHERELCLLKKPSKTSSVYFMMEHLLWDAKAVAKLLGIKEGTVWGYKARADKYVHGEN